ncbi:unnamed protein product [Rodentolepis nana]|uniref:Uncharacterized protein n=1 Tax=Rodentolepis nana TaxID=102285 RepID=A0A3P7S483_RODNA|nr:unnamed protein product [Rodentolepis nana]
MIMYQSAVDTVNIVKASVIVSPSGKDSNARLSGPNAKIQHVLVMGGV